MEQEEYGIGHSPGYCSRHPQGALVLRPRRFAADGQSAITALIQAAGACLLWKYNAADKAAVLSKYLYPPCTTKLPKFHVFSSLQGWTWLPPSTFSLSLL
jgi:hypothetical protein